jgi:hypothetical protein
VKGRVGGGQVLSPFILFYFAGVRGSGFEVTHLSPRNAPGDATYPREKTMV